MPARLPDTEYRLNNSKRRLLEENIGFIHYMTNTILNIYPDIPRDQYDDIFQDCAIDFIKCLKEFDPSKSKITTYSSKKILSEYKRRMKRYNRKKNILGEYYLEDIANKNNYDNEDMNFCNAFSDNYNYENDIIDNIIKTEILEKLETKFSKRDLEVINLYMNGIEQADIARKYNISRQRVGQIINRFRKEGQELMNVSGIYQ